MEASIIDEDDLLARYAPFFTIMEGAPMTRVTRLLGPCVLLLSLLIAPNVLAKSAGAPAHQAAPARSLCDDNAPLCTETADSIGYEGKYTGHDEPAVLFYSNTPGSGNSNIYHLTLPKEPPTLPKQDGTGGTFNFQLHPAFWFGMAMCDTQSSPEFTHAPCAPDSDTNIFDGADPTAADYIGKHPGTAFMEMQFYPPGWVAWPPGNSCDATQWCAALNIDSLSQNPNAGVNNNAACLNSVGVEPVNFAFITKSGAADSPGDPLNGDHFSINPATELFMNSGDELVVDLHDTPAGFQVVINDLTTHQSGAMTASIANGFAQVNFDPTATTCTSAPYAFHPMYSTSSEHTRVPWAAHGYNVAFSDEIGHFEYCNAASPADGTCITAGASDPSGVDDDDFGCFNAADSTRIQIGGCLGTDIDFDGVSYQHTWPGSLSNPGQDRRLNPSPIMFSSPLFMPAAKHRLSSKDASGKQGDLQNFSRAAFEADLPRIEAADLGGICNRTTGANCVNPPPGANFYPFFSTRRGDGNCLWQEGGANIPGTRNTFGGNSTVEFGPLLQLVYPGVGFKPVFRFNNFRRVLNNNPCEAKQS
jgi:hypothetical protein